MKTNADVPLTYSLVCNELHRKGLLLKEWIKSNRTIVLKRTNNSKA